jgi:hypothetical protein
MIQEAEDVVEMASKLWQMRGLSDGRIGGWYWWWAVQ